MTSAILIGDIDNLIDDFRDLIDAMERENRAIINRTSQVSLEMDDCPQRARAPLECVEDAIDRIRFQRDAARDRVVEIELSARRERQ